MVKRGPKPKPKALLKRKRDHKRERLTTAMNKGKTKNASVRAAKTAAEMARRIEIINASLVGIEWEDREEVPVPDGPTSFKSPWPSFRRVWTYHVFEDGSVSKIPDYIVEPADDTPREHWHQNWRGKFPVFLDFDEIGWLRAVLKSETLEVISTSRAYQDLAYEAVMFGRKGRKDRNAELAQHVEDEGIEQRERNRARRKYHGGE
jgi:hypothetical protein